MKISRQCLLILSENKETGAKVAISKGREKKARSHGAPSSHAFESIFFFPDFLLQICIIPRSGDGTTPKRALLQGEDDGEGHKWKVLRGRGGEINVFYGRGSASQLQLRKEDKKVDAHRAARPQKQAKAG